MRRVPGASEFPRGEGRLDAAGDGPQRVAKNLVLELADRVEDALGGVRWTGGTQVPLDPPAAFRTGVEARAAAPAAMTHLAGCAKGGLELRARVGHRVSPSKKMVRPRRVAGRRTPRQRSWRGVCSASSPLKVASRRAAHRSPDDPSDRPGRLHRVQYSVVMATSPLTRRRRLPRASWGALGDGASIVSRGNALVKRSHAVPMTEHP